MQDQKEYPGQIAIRNFNRFRLELGLRSNNEHAGSGLGGNPTEFWFVVNHNFKVYVDNTIMFETTGPNEITAYIPGHKGVKVADIRRAFSSFVASHPDRVDISNENLTNLSFLRDLKVNHPNAAAFIKGVEKAHELAHWADVKIAFQKEIHSFFGKEILFLETQFLKELGLSETYLQDLRDKNEKARKDGAIDYSDQNRGDDPSSAMFKSHPIWGAKRKAILEREKVYVDNLLSQEDKDRMEFLGSLPPFVMLQVVRSIVQIDRI